MYRHLIQYIFSKFNIFVNNFSIYIFSQNSIYLLTISAYICFLKIQTLKLATSTTKHNWEIPINELIKKKGSEKKKEHLTSHQVSKDKILITDSIIV